MLKYEELGIKLTVEDIFYRFSRIFIIRVIFEQFQGDFRLVETIFSIILKVIQF